MRASTSTVLRGHPDVVVVDDHADTAEMISELLAFHGFTVRAFTDALRALEDMRAHPPDLALLDLRMPGVGGAEVARRMRQDPRLCGIVLVAVTGAVEAQASTPDAFDAALSKPIDATTLPELLRELADVRRSGVRPR